MPLPKDLEDSLAAAGRAADDERRREQDARAQEKRERAEQIEAEARARSDAPANAEAIFAWLLNAEADELRAAMRLHGVERARVGTFGFVRGEWRPGPSFGSCTVYLIAHVPMLLLTIVMGYHGGGSHRVTSAVALAGFMPARALATLAHEVRSGRALDLVRAGLLDRGKA